LSGAEGGEADFGRYSNSRSYRARHPGDETHLACGAPGCLDNPRRSVLPIAYRRPKFTESESLLKIVMTTPAPFDKPRARDRV
jgi:hypothetical protein